MSLLWVIVGSFFQFGLAGLFFMLAVFAGGGYASGGGISKLKLTILNLSIAILPGSCILSAVIVIYQYTHDGTANSYWWYGMPFVVVSIYMSLINRI